MKDFMIELMNVLMNVLMKDFNFVHVISFHMIVIVIIGHSDYRNIKLC